MEDQFRKYHGLGNDYIVIDPARFTRSLTCDLIQRLCDRHLGIGSDGILYGPCSTDELPGAQSATSSSANSTDVENSSPPGVSVRIFNPDGSEAEKSGNGLRIFARYLQDIGHVHEGQQTIETLGGQVCCTLWQNSRDVRVEMGRITFKADEIPVSETEGEVLENTVDVAGEAVTFSAASVGNPHCIVIRDSISKQETCRIGPELENWRQFPYKSNVQFMQIIDRHTVAIEIWERGAGYTLASGSSASASAATAVRLGFCEPPVAVKMPGGTLEIELDEDYSAYLKGPVTAVCAGTVCPDVYT